MFCALLCLEPKLLWGELRLLWGANCAFWQQVVAKVKTQTAMIITSPHELCNAHASAKTHKHT